MIESLDVVSSLASAQLSGQAFPQTDISGRLELPPLLPIDVRVQRDQGYHLDLSQGDLKLSSVWSSLTRLEFAHLQGAGLLANFGNAASDLFWQRETGFSGNLDLDLKLPNQPLVFQLKAVGQGSLELSGQGFLQDSPLSTLGLTLSPDASSVTGRAGINVDVSQRYNLESPLVITSDLDISGSLLHLGVIGPINVSGLVNAQGQVTASDIFREGRLELTGDLQVNANYNAEGYNFQASIERLDLSELLPQLNLPVLTSRLSITPSPDRKPLIQSDFSLELENSQITGDIFYDQTWQGNLDR